MWQSLPSSRPCASGDDSPCHDPFALIALVGITSTTFPPNAVLIVGGFVQAEDSDADSALVPLMWVRLWRRAFARKNSSSRRPLCYSAYMRAGDRKGSAAFTSEAKCPFTNVSAVCCLPLPVVAVPNQTRARLRRAPQVQRRPRRFLASPKNCVQRVSKWYRTCAGSGLVWTSTGCGDWLRGACRPRRAPHPRAPHPASMLSTKNVLKEIPCLQVSLRRARHRRSLYHVAIFQPLRGQQLQMPPREPNHKTIGAAPTTSAREGVALRVAAVQPPPPPSIRGTLLNAIGPAAAVDALDGSYT